VSEDVLEPKNGSLGGRECSQGGQRRETSKRGGGSSERHTLTLDTASSLAADRANPVGSAAGQWAAGVVAFAPVLGLAIAQGGYFPTAWGWASVPLLWSASVALVLRGRLRLSRPERVFLAALAAFSAWVAVSAAWSTAPAASVLETERALVYLAAGVAVLVVARSHSSPHVLAGLLVAVSLVAVFSLATRVLPNRVGVYDGAGTYRLSEPIGYWNGLGLFAAMGAVLALGFAARARMLIARAGCAAVLVVLLPTLYFTFGRAAWIALGAGLLAAVAVDPRRLQLLATLIAVGAAPAFAVLIASRERGLTHTGSSLAVAAHDGHRVALAIAVLAGANAVVATAIALAERRVRIGRVAQRLFALAVIALALAGVAAALTRYGGPVKIARTAYASFKAPSPHGGANLNQRLLSFSGSGRADLWRLAWDDAVRHPLFGAGAGTYERYFLSHQPANPGLVRDAHSLYLETLAELGPVGLALLIALLLSPALVLRRARRQPLVPAAVGAYVAYLVHAGVDWDWELPAVTLVALMCASTIMLAGRTVAAAPPALLSPGLRWSMAGLAVAAATFATIALVGNAALSHSQTALARGDQATAAADARRARTLLPWSPVPWEALGRAQLGAGLLADARGSFRKAVSIDPGDWQAWYDLANVTTGAERARSLDRVAVLFPRSGLVRSGQ
jgi:hypothetical protein